MLVKIIKLRLGSESYTKCEGNVYIEDPRQQHKFFSMRCDFVIRLKAQAVQFNTCGLISRHLTVV